MVTFLWRIPVKVICRWFVVTRHKTDNKADNGGRPGRGNILRHFQLLAPSGAQEMQMYLCLFDENLSELTIFIILSKVCFMSQVCPRTVAGQYQFLLKLYISVLLAYFDIQTKLKILCLIQFRISLKGIIITRWKDEAKVRCCVCVSVLSGGWNCATL